MSDSPVRDFHPIQYEKMLIQKGNSYVIADGWTIAWVTNGWKVYFNAIDATVRLHIGAGTAGDPRGLTFASFSIAWEWVAELTPWEVEMITVNSVDRSGQ